MMASLAFTAMRHLKKAVDVGLVDGTRAATTPMGRATRTRPLSSSWSTTPTVLMSFMDSQRVVELRRFLRTLCSTTPKPVSCTAIRASSSAAAAPAAAMAAQTRSTSSWLARAQSLWASLAEPASRLASWMDTRSASNVPG
jgi:hypothetical protein